MRTSEIIRKTSETQIALVLNLDGSALDDEIDTGVGFLDHMLALFARHGRFGLTVHAIGDTNVDDHHTVEDVGICLGAAFDEALGNRSNITRYGSIILPMDETLVLAAVDISGRSHLTYDMGRLPDKVGAFDTELAREFWLSFTRRSGITLHLKRLDGTNAHHILEACFKAAARALSDAVAFDERGDGVPSTKGTLTAIDN